MAISYFSLWSCDSACFTCSLAAKIQWITGGEGNKREERGISFGIFLLCFLLPQFCSFGTRRTENIIWIPAVNTDPSLWLSETRVPTHPVTGKQKVHAASSQGACNSLKIGFYNCFQVFTLLCCIPQGSFRVCFVSQWLPVTARTLHTASFQKEHSQVQRHHFFSSSKGAFLLPFPVFTEAGMLALLSAFFPKSPLALF